MAMTSFANIEIAISLQYGYGIIVLKIRPFVFLSFYTTVDYKFSQT